MAEKAFDDRMIIFADGSSGEYDAVILATGYRPDLRRLLPDCSDLLTEEGAPLRSGPDSGRDGLFFCSYRVSPTGQFREIGIEARGIADAAMRSR